MTTTEEESKELADLTIETRHEGEIVFYQCYWPKYWGWAYIMIDDKTGMIAITSDHGNWSFVWNPKHIGAPTLHDFLFRTNVGYAMSKLIPHDRIEKPDFDLTKKAIVRALLEDRRERLIDADLARERYNELVDWTDDYAGIYGGWSFPDWVEDPWEQVVSSETSEATAFRTIIWPVVRKAVQGELAHRRERAA